MTPVRNRRSLLGTAVVALCSAALTGSAHAAVPREAPAPTSFLLLKAGDIYSIRSDKTGLRRLTTSGGVLEAEWSPDRTKIAFSATVSGNTDIYVMPSAGGARTRKTFGVNKDSHPTWSPDGKRIAFASRDKATDSFENIFTLSMATGSRPVRVTDAAGDTGGCMERFYNRPNWHPTNASLILMWDGCWGGDPHSSGFDTVIYNLSTKKKVGRVWQGTEGTWSRNGRFITAEYDPNYDIGEPTVIARFDATGDHLNDVTAVRYDARYATPMFSPDGTRIAYTRWGAKGTGVWTSRATGGDHRMFISGYTLLDWR